MKTGIPLVVHAAVPSCSPDPENPAILSSAAFLPIMLDHETRHPLKMSILALSSAAIFSLPAISILLSNPDQPEGIGAIVLLILSPAVFLLSLLACFLLRRRNPLYLLLLSIWLLGYFILIFDFLPQASWGERILVILYPLAVALPTLFAGRRRVAPPTPAA